MLLEMFAGMRRFDATYGIASLLPVCLGLVLAVTSVWAQQITVTGRLIDSQQMPVPDARVEIGPETTTTDPLGRFRVSIPPGEYPVEIRANGYYPVNRSAKVAGDYDAGDIRLTRWQEIPPLFTVEGRATLAASTPSETGVLTRRGSQRSNLKNEDIVNVPFPAPQDYRNAFALLPNVLFDQLGQFHLNGGNVRQADVRLDGFDIVDPQTNYLQARISLDAVKEVDTTVSGRQADAARGSAGDVNLTTARGAVDLRYLATDFIPSMSTEQGWHVDRWTPRALFSTPLGRGCALHGWFEQAVDAFYHVNLVNGLPAGANEATAWDFSSITHAGYIFGKHNLAGTFLYNRSHGYLEGLSITSPAETTTNRLEHLYFSAVKDHIDLQHGSVEMGIADHRVDTRIDPQGGDTIFDFTPNGRRGDYFVRSDRSARREQAFVNVLERWRDHLVQAGVQIERPGFEQTTARTGFRVIRTDDSVAETVTFAGSPYRSNRNLETAAYLRDSWDSGGLLHLEGGLRADRNSTNGSVVLGPQVGLALLPFRESTKIRASWGRFFDHPDLDLLSLDQDQTATLAFFDEAGTLVRGPVATRYAIDRRRLKTPQSDTAAVGIERRMLGGLGTVSYTHRRAGNQYVFVPGGTDAATVYSLGNSRTQTYDAIQVSGEKTFSRASAFVAYIRSRNHNNALIDYSIDTAVTGVQQGGPVPWDAPNRLVARGWVGLPKPRRLRREGTFEETTFGYFAEYRTGYPFTVTDETQTVVGRPNSMRYPSYMSVDVSVEQRVRLLGRRWAARLMVVNLTDRLNPVSVVSDIASPLFLQYGRGQKRSYSFRLRLLDSLERRTCGTQSASHDSC